MGRWQCRGTGSMTLRIAERAESAASASGDGHSAVLFPGLAPARHGKVAAFLSQYPPAVRLLQRFDEVLGYRLLDRYRTAEVYDWEVYQSAHLATIFSLAHARVHGNLLGMEPVNVDRMMVCGQSFGSFAAAAFAESIEITELIGLLRASTSEESAYFAEQPPLGCVFFTRLGETLRGRLLDEVARDTGGWLELSVAQDRGVTAVSGTLDAVHKFTARIKAEGAVVFYVMNRAEHCPRMQPLVERLRENVYSQANFRDPQVPLVSDNGKLLRTAEQVREDLAAGWSRPLLSEQLYRKLEECGVERMLTPSSRGTFSDFGQGRFDIEVILPNAMLRALHREEGTEFPAAYAATGMHENRLL